MWKLFKIYQVDFEMFDYGIDNYEQLFLWQSFFNTPCETKVGLILSLYCIVDIVYLFRKRKSIHPLGPWFQFELFCLPFSYEWVYKYKLTQVGLFVF